jgi:hypothetical protein
MLCITALAFGAIFWPGIYRYDRVEEGSVRTNRLTGSVQVLSGGGWTALDVWSATDLQDLPATELTKLVGTGSFRGGRSFEVELYNGSRWRVNEIEYEITAAKGHGNAPGNPYVCVGSECTRRFRQSVSIPPLGSYKDDFSVGGSVEGCEPTWHIVSARGRLEG